MRPILWDSLMPTVKIGYDKINGIPFHEAIKAAQQRDVVLPDVYYGDLQGLARQLAFSVAGIAALDQLENVKNSLSAALQRGESQQKWSKEVLESGVLELPDYRLDNIFRTNIQNSYNRGRWERFQRVKATRPYLMYDAINDSRVRPHHLAMDGVIRPVDDPIWNTWMPSNGYRCRCRVISLSEKQALARSGQGKGINKPIPGDVQPDKGWDYNPGADLTEGVKRALDNRDNDVLLAVLAEKVDAFKDEQKAGYVDLNTKKAVEEFLVKNDIVDYADFGKIDNMGIINDMARGMYDTIKEFPELRKNQKFMGSCQAQFARFYDMETERVKNFALSRGYNEADAKYFAKNSVKKLKVTGNRYAHSWGQKNVSGIAFNEKFGRIKDKDELQRYLDNDVQTGYHPFGCNTVKSVVDHELGHQLDDLLDLKNDLEITNLYQKILTVSSISFEVSKYAGKNIKEFIAESWAEFRNNEKPGQVAAEVGRIIQEKYATRYRN